MNNINEITEAIKSNTNEQLEDVIKKWYEKIRTQSMKIGATYISAAIYGVIKKHTIKKEKVSLRDYKRAIDEIINIIAVQLPEQNSSEQSVMEETSNDE